ncbi:hypothetical protein ACFLW6_01360 [Chloroflexota bacterium]
MDDLDYLINYIMAWAMFWTAHDIAKGLTKIRTKAEEKELTKALEHEPTQENLQYYRDLKLEKANRQEMRQREIDREKIRHLVFSDRENNTASS